MKNSNMDILIVDDITDNIRLLSNILNAAGYNARGAANGQSALMLIEANPPDLILLDIKMPDMNGFEVAKKIKENEETKDIPIIFLSSIKDSSEKVKAFNAGAIDYMSKPFVAEELLARLKTHLTLSNWQKELEFLVDERTRELNQTKKFNEDIVQNLSEAILVSDADEKIIFVNPTFIDLLGYSLEEVLGKKAKDFVLERDTEKIIEGVQRRQKGDTDSYEVNLIHKNGSHLSTIVSATPQSVDGKYSGTLTVITNISDLRKTEKALEATEIQYSSLLENAPNAIFVSDSAGKIVLANTQTTQLLGYEKEEMIGENIDTLLPDELQRGHSKNRRNFFNNPKLRRMGEGRELAVKHVDGHLIPVHISLSPVNSSEGMLVTSIIHDITDIKEQETLLRNSHMSTTIAVAKLAESRDDETGKHIERVQLYCRELAIQLQLSSSYQEKFTDKFIESLYHASPLHDIGKVGIPDSVLLKPGKLTDEEFDLMKTHTIIGAETLERVKSIYPNNDFINMGVNIARSHHEKWDGSGYPDKKAGKKIPLVARIMAVADVYDALRSERPYKDAFSHEKSIGIILEGKGQHFDPEIINSFEIIQEKFLAISLDKSS